MWAARNSRREIFSVEDFGFDSNARAQGGDGRGVPRWHVEATRLTSQRCEGAASLAYGTGDIDCVYHIALDELIETVNALDYPDARDTLMIMIRGKRLRDISDLPLD